MLLKIGQAAIADLTETATVHDRDKAFIQAVAKAAQGMSLRDYFAGQAIAGVFSPGIWPNADQIKTAATAAYIAADAMLAARGVQ